MSDKIAKILVVEDDENVRRPVCAWLEISGYAVTEAGDGDEALRRIADIGPDAVLLDLRLPRRDGFGVLEALSREHDAPPVIVISGQDGIDGVIRAFRLGATDYLQKPIVSFDLLAHALEAALERRELARAVKQAENRYFTLVQSLPLLVFILDKHLELTFINKFCRPLLGFSRAEALAAPGFFPARLHPEDRDRVTAWLGESLGPGKASHTEECRFLHKNGATIHALLRAIPSARDKNGGDDRQIEGIVVDITDRVELERFVVQEEKLKTLGAISAEVAHEIRNPLFSIAGFAHRLQARLPDSREAGIILSEARRLEDILDKIRNYLHPVDLRPRLCSLRAIAMAALDFLAPEFAARGIVAAADLAGGLPDLRLDPDLLTQVVTSLTRFAVSRSPAGQTVQLATSRHARYAHLDVTFRPSRPVVDPEVLFLPFEEGDERLGLPLAYRIVKNMGGSLTFAQHATEAGFTLQLPIDPLAEDPDGPDPDALETAMGTADDDDDAPGLHAPARPGRA
ncbi:ATP-binding response regulator [Solidesulfovibrio magneticus]|uniref:histidine kinase n=1 Tax=Solidesulfovibrio magneticus (strain ATCC 700980 / DSM 13731 / RS-1) TaxID=573370 RepID=C4XL40_SOLM1|nr:response regulator [Solidesulfovibrio magneticus]BAH76981.1 putative two-component hybrid sensor and regulator [Solidesulfovibrio magneticus RS-1]